MSRRIIEISTGAVLIIMGPLAAALAYWGSRDLDHRQIILPILSVSLLMGWLALIALFSIMIKARNDTARSEELVQRLSSAVHQTADAVFITDRSGLIEYVNPALARDFGPVNVAHDNLK